MATDKVIKRSLVSVIVPAFKQEKTIAKDLLRIQDVLGHSEYPYEIIVVVDGDVDKTFENAQTVGSEKLKIVGYKHNRGKGYAIRYGMVRSKGDIICFIDAGGDLNPNGLLLMLDFYKWHNVDIIIGSKRHAESKVIYPWHRRLISSLSQMLIRFLFGLNIKDTQVGMKLFKREVIENVIPRLLVKKFAFDIEILVVAYSLGYKRIFETPVELKYDFSGSIVSKNISYELFKTLWDSLAIFYRLKLRGYYNDKNKRKWKYDPELEFKINVG